MTKIFILIAFFALITSHAARDGLVYDGGPMMSQAPTGSQGQAPMVSLASIVSQAPIMSPTEFEATVETPTLTLAQTEYTVPLSQLNDARNYGFSLWVKASYLSPAFFNFDALHTFNLGIAGIYETGTDYCGVQIGSRALTVELLQGGFTQNPALAFKTYSIVQRNNRDYSQEFPTRQDYDHEWNFIYAAYSYDLTQTFSYVYFSNSDRVLTNTSNQIIKRWPLTALNFKLGGCSDNAATFQGQYSNVAFFYGGNSYYTTDAEYLKLYRGSQRPTADIPQLTAMKIEEIIQGTPIESLTSSQSLTDRLLTSLNGVGEYSVWGWCKLNAFTQSNTADGFNTLFRVSSDLPGETSDSSDVGDRTLSAFIGQNILQFSTYTFDWAGRMADSKDYKQNVTTSVEELSQWFYVYFGYSQALQEAFAFVKFQNMQHQLTWGNVYQMRADRLVLQFGNDDFHPTLDAKFQNWNFAHGPGAYIKQGFETYYSTAVFESSQSKDVVTNDKQLEYYDSGFKDEQCSYYYQVPQAELALVEDISMSFWFRWSYQYPDYADVQTLQSPNSISVAHVSETNNTGTNMGDRLLSLWLKPLKYGKKIYAASTYAKSSGRPNIERPMQVVDDQDFDGAWGWFYFGYSKQKTTLVAYMRFLSGTILYKTWDDANTHNYPPEALHLIIGKSSASPNAFNGQFYNIEFKHKSTNFLGTQAEIDAYYNGPLIKADLKPVPFYDELIQMEVVEFVGGAPQTGKVYSTVDGQGATEYAVYGWSKWTSTKDKQDKHIMFRLTTDEEDRLGDKEKPGDRTLMYYVGNGVIVASTYSINFITPTPNDNALENQFPYEDDLETWFWVYFGYNYKTQTAFTYAVFYDRILSYRFQQPNPAIITHIIPRRFRFTLGHDNYMNSFHGQMKNFHLVWGVGAYRESNLQELFQAYEPINQDELGLDLFWEEEPATLISFADQQEPVITIQLNPEQLAQNITQYSFSFWTRFGFFDPRKVDINTVEQNNQALAGITELDGYNQAGLGAKALSLYINKLDSAQPTYLFSTYSTNRNQDNDSKELPFSEEDFDTQWNWVYFGYSLDFQRATAYVYYSRTRQTQILKWDQTIHYLPKALKFQLGKPAGDSAVGFNGLFYDVRFRYDQSAYKERGNIVTYFSSVINKPPAYRPALTKLGLTSIGEQNNIAVYYSTKDNQVASNNLWEFAENYRGVQQYAVYGWAKWTETPDRAEQHTIFRLTSNTLSQAQDSLTMGDRTLACFVYRNTIRFSTYRYQAAQVQDGQQVIELNYGVEYGDDLTSWFFIYFGYSRQDKKAKVFVKFPQREVQYTFDNVNQNIGRYYGLYLAKDRFYPSFNGYLNQWVLSMGDGSFEESNFQPLYNLVEDVTDNKYYSQATFVDPVENTEIVEILTDLYEEEVPEDYLQGMTTITAWTWFSWGFQVPKQFGNPQTGFGNCYQIARIIYAVGKGVYAELCFSLVHGNAAVQFTETSGAIEQVISKQLPSYNDLDSNWNFVYMTHNKNTSTTTVYVYFGDSQEKWVHTFRETYWSFENYVRFKLAGGSDSNKRFNGRFFDAQKSIFVQYSQQNITQIEDVQSKITITPPKFRQDYLSNTSDIIPFTTQSDGEIQTTDTFNTPVDRHFIGYEQITSYSVRGWTRWEGSIIRNSSRLVHRVQQGILKDLTDDQQPGDRALTIYLTVDGFLEFSTYNYEGTESNNSIKITTPFTVDKLVVHWFFIYHGYSFIEQQSFIYVSFYDKTEFYKVVDNIRQFQSVNYAMYLGRDTLSQSSAWNGSFNSWVFSAGNLSYISDPVRAQTLRGETGTQINDWTDVVEPNPGNVTNVLSNNFADVRNNTIQHTNFNFNPVNPGGRGRVVNNKLTNDNPTVPTQPNGPDSRPTGPNRPNSVPTQPNGPSGPDEPNSGPTESNGPTGPNEPNGPTGPNGPISEPTEPSEPNKEPTGSNSGPTESSGSNSGPTQPTDQFSYFLGEDNINEPFAIEITQNITNPEEQSICFGFIPETLTHLLKENPDARYTDDSISVCTNGLQNSCLGAPDCINGNFDTTKGATYLWKFEGDKVILKKQPTTAGCTLVSQSETSNNYQEGDKCYQDVIRYLNYIPGGPPEPQYQCTFKREGKNAEAGTRDRLVPFVELRGKVSVLLLVDESGDSDVIDSTQQNPCQNTIRVDTTQYDCIVPPPPAGNVCAPPNEYRIYPDCTPTPEPTGPSGSSNFTGPSGPTGHSDFTGPSGPNEFTGPSGPSEPIEPSDFTEPSQSFQPDCSLCNNNNPNPNPDVVDTRLVDGILQVEYNNEWRYVCNDKFSVTEADVACRSIYGNNYQTENLFLHQNCQGQDTLNFWLVDVVCTGEEINLAKCTHPGWGINNCTQRDCIRLSCSEIPVPEVSTLVHSDNGILNILYKDELQAICDDVWGETDSAVACTELYGFPDFYSFQKDQECNTQDFWLTQVECSGKEIKIQECKHNPFGEHDCVIADKECIRLYCVGGGPQPPPLISITDGRLVQNQTSGILSFKYEGSVQGICDENFDQKGASVACYELYHDGTVLNFKTNQKCDHTGFWLDNVMCLGAETAIRNCPHTGYRNYAECDWQYECVALWCAGGGPQELPSSLKKPTPVVEGPAHVTHSKEGILSILYKDERKAVCDDSFGDQEAQVACFELYGSSDFISYETGKQCIYQDFWIDDIVCAGTEATIQQCQHSSWGSHNCDSSNSCVSLFCRDGGPNTSTEVLMHQGGQLQILRDGEVKSVCHHQFNQFAAQSACFSMYGSYNVLSFTLDQSCIYTSFWVDNIVCSSQQPTLSACPHDPFGTAECDGNSCILLYCDGFGPQPEGEKIGFAEHNNQTGILNYNYNGESKAVCDDQWSQQNSEVACLELYQDPTVIGFKIGQRCDYQSFWLDDIACGSNNQKLGDCVHLPYGLNGCNPSFDCVELYCAGGGPQPPAQNLTGSKLTQSLTGIISLTVDGVPGNICQNGFDTQEANVACQELFGVEADSYQIGMQCPYDNFWINDTDCQGTEQNLYACASKINKKPSSFAINQRCGPSQCVQLFCLGKGPKSPGVILVQSETGNLQIKHNEKIKNICDNGFNSYGAEIACQELFGVSYTSFSLDKQCDGIDEGFWLDQVLCVGHEDRLIDCPHHPWGQHTCGDTDCIKLICNGQGYQSVEPPVVLIHNQTSGVLSISRDDVPKGVCDDGFGQTEAEVACFELYANSTVLYYSGEAQCDHSSFWLDDVVCDGQETKLKDCQHLSWGQSNCDSKDSCVQLFCAGGGPCYNCAPPPPTEIPELKVNSNGVLQIIYQSETRAVCDDNFTSISGQVACRELYGAESQVVKLLVQQKCVDDDFWLDEVKCDGEEAYLYNCPQSGIGNHDCVAEDDECIQLFCTGGGPEPNTAPLVHGGSGILNILYNGEIKAVCDDGFSDFAAQTACQELYGNPEVIFLRVDQPCDYKAFWLDDVDCSEVKSKLTLCQHAPLGQSNCDSTNECVFLQCTAQPVDTNTTKPPPPITNILIHNQETGVLSISKDGDIRALCDDIWTDLNAAVACKELYGNPSFESFNTDVECDYQQFWLDQVDCSGSETRIDQCSNSGWGVHDCYPSYECVQLFCTAGGPLAPSGELWQNPVTGVISITYQRETRGLCDDGFSQENAEVICMELYGNPSVDNYFTNKRCDFQDFWLDDVVCTGSESKINDCEHKPYGTHNCKYQSQCLKVYCTSGGPQIPAGILVHTQTGLLAISYDNETKSLADSGFGDNEARTACTELYVSPHFTSYRTGQNCLVENFWLDNVVCSEDKTNIDSCQHSNYGEVNTLRTPSSCVELFCAAGGPSPPKGTLVHTNTTGILNIRYQDSIKSVCHNKFDDQDAEVACKELYGSKVFISFQTGQACENQEFWIDNVECNGQEDLLQDCPHLLWGQTNCNPLNGCVRLYCQAGGPLPEVPPPVLEHSSTGILSITFNGETRALCDDLFDDSSASVACFELYGSYQFHSYQSNQLCDYPTYWINDFQCLGTETALAGCRQTHVVYKNCNANNCVKLFCSGFGPQQVFVTFVHDPTTAIIQVDKDALLKGICDNGFQKESADVFCQSLYNDPTVIQYSQGHNCGASITDFWLDQVKCIGNETNLGVCSHLEWGVHNCNPLYECVQVYCAGGGPQPPAHLTQSLEGILSITYLGTSKAVCDENFNDQSASVACTELFGAPNVTSYSHGHQCVYKDHWLSNVVCLGAETKLQDCHHSPWGDACVTNTCVKLFCSAGGNQPVIGRVVHSNTTGIISYTHETVTKAICDDFFELEEAQIACYELYANNEVISFSQGQNCEYDEFWLDNVQCSGTERLLGECVHMPYGEHDCLPRTQCIKLVCAGGGYRPEEEVPVLYHGSDASLNMVYNGEVRSVCDNEFKDFSANVACKELYGDPVFLRWSGQHDCTHTSFWLDNVRCNGDEKSLMDCNHSPLGVSNCGTNQCIKLYCRAGGPKVDASPLVHGSNGILSILHEGSIKAVCDIPFNSVSASVACRELYSNPNVLSFTLNQQCNENEFWLDHVECNGGETRMVDCQHNLWGYAMGASGNTCDYTIDCVRLSCEGGGWGSIYGADGHLIHNQTSGVLSIKSEGIAPNMTDPSSLQPVVDKVTYWGVNDYLFGHKEAQVACFELYGKRSYVSFKAGFTCDYHAFWANDIICQGQESSIKECQHTSWSEMPDPTKSCVQLMCTEAGPELNSTGTLHLGSDKILAITYNGETKAVCEDGFTLKNAQVACLELTGVSDVLEFSGGHRCEYDSFWLDDIDCLGSETFLQDCRHLRWGQNNCSADNQCIELICGTTPQPQIVVIHNPDTGVITLSIDTVEQGICDDLFGLENAQVICNQLYEKPDVLNFAQGQACSGGCTGFWLDDISCEGSEANILDCSHNPLGVNNCNIADQCVQVYCKAGGPQPLAHLTQNSDGILSITYVGEAKALCHNGFTENSARVACLELYGSPDVVNYEINHACAYQEFWVDRVACVGKVEETRVQLCPNGGFGNASCNPATDCVRLQCLAGGYKEEQITVIQNPETGILSVSYTDVVKSLCQHAFDQADAEVVCRQLYGRDAVVISFSHGHVCEYPDYWLSDIECQGDENSVNHCDHLPMGTHSCNSANQCVQLYCSAGPQPPLILPPVLTQNGQGILQINYNKENRDVCQQGFDANAATVACRELFNSSSIISFEVDQPCQYNDFWLEGLLCQGTEENLMSCVHKDLGSHNCGPNQCVRLFCLGGGASPIPVNEESTLIHGQDGILSITYRDENRSICDDGFSQNAAQVACNQLYGDSHVLSYAQQEQCTYDKFWLDDVVCIGDEAQLQICHHSQWGTHNCDSSNSCIKLFCLGGGPQPPSNTTETPVVQPELECIVLYSKCGYSGDSVSMCGDLQAALSEDELGWQVMCIRIPDNYQVKIFDKNDDGTGEVDITESIPCLDKDQEEKNVQSIHIEQAVEFRMIQSKRLNKKPLSFALKSKTITKHHHHHKLLRKNRI